MSAPQSDPRQPDDSQGTSQQVMSSVIPLHSRSGEASPQAKLPNSQICFSNEPNSSLDTQGSTTPPSSDIKSYISGSSSKGTDLSQDTRLKFLPERDITMEVTIPNTLDIKEYEYPAEYREKDFDAIIINSEKDSQMAKNVQSILERSICLNDNRPPSICVLDTDDDETWLEQADQNIGRSTFMFVLMTRNIVGDTWANMLKDDCLMRSLKDPTKRWCVVPLHTLDKESIKYPFGLRAQRGIDIKNIQRPGMDQNFVEKIKELFNKRLKDKLDRERKKKGELQEWLCEEKIRRQEEGKEIRRGVKNISLDLNKPSGINFGSGPPPSVVNIFNYGNMQTGDQNIQNVMHGTAGKTQTDGVDWDEGTTVVDYTEQSTAPVLLGGAPPNLKPKWLSNDGMCDKMKKFVHEMSDVYDEMKSDLSSSIAPYCYTSLEMTHESFTNCQSHTEDIEKANFEKERLHFVTFNNTETDDLADDLSYVLDKISDQLTKINSKFQGNFQKVGSFIDGSKVREIDEFDCLFVCTSNYFKGLHSVETAKLHTRKLFLSDNTTEVHAGKLRDEFADALHEAISNIKLPTHLQHSGFNSASRGFAGIRINKPTCTMLLKSDHNGEWQAISLDVTIAFQLPRKDEEKLKKQVFEKIKDLRSQNKGFDREGKLHLVPVVNDVWQVTTTLLEAYLLSHVPGDILRTCMRFGKCICYRYITTHAKSDHIKLCSKPSGSFGRYQKKILEELDQHTCSTIDCKGIYAALLYGHTLLPPDKADRYDESAKTVLAVDSAAIKHLVMREIISKPEYREEGHLDKKILRVLKDVFSHLGNSDETCVDHVMLSYPIKMISVAPYAIDFRAELTQCAKLRCMAIAERLESQLKMK